ncbi:hypothetical protein H671_6g16113 [Cricetulus griseus]|uniref:Uncharacterized protein n=1 Tax=Cricetulus griseus TaxID=10029 RepID=A0A061I0Y9_CRIGR|nr:hypothetical protein H671_6g16113 [Cricetulus griseus]
MHESLGSIPNTAATGCGGAHSSNSFVIIPDPLGVQPGMHETQSQEEKRRNREGWATPAHLDRKDNRCKFKASLVCIETRYPELHSEIRSQNQKKKGPSKWFSR